MEDDNIYPQEVPQAMSARVFRRFSTFIHDELGIKMGPHKQTMLQSRLSKRLRTLQLNSYEQYCDYLFSSEGFREELPIFIHQVTTNKTEFFREPTHYGFLAELVLPALGKNPSRGRKLSLWSSACSTGEEPYTLAMVLSEYARSHPGFDFDILATDISPAVLEEATRGVYDEGRVDPVPLNMKKRYLLRSKDRKKNLIRVAPELRSKVRFQWANLKSPLSRLTNPVDIIFCRNVIIYFDRPTQQLVLGNLCALLKPGGYIFMGHSETLNSLSLPLTPVVQTVYQKT